MPMCLCIVILFTYIWLEYFIGKLKKKIKNDKKPTKKFVMVSWLKLLCWLSNCTKYDIRCCDFLNMCTLALKMLLMHFLCILKYFVAIKAFGKKSVVMVAHSFGGLVLKSLVVEAHKHVYQRPMNHLDFEAQKCCEFFWTILNVWCFIVYHMWVVPKAYQNISSGNVNKWKRIQPN